MKIIGVRYESISIRLRVRSSVVLIRGREGVYVFAGEGFGH